MQPAIMPCPPKVQAPGKPSLLALMQQKQRSSELSSGLIYCLALDRLLHPVRVRWNLTLVLAVPAAGLLCVTAACADREHANLHAHSVGETTIGKTRVRRPRENAQGRKPQGHPGPRLGEAPAKMISFQPL